MSERHVRPPEKVHRAFVQTKQSPAQRKRVEDAAEAEQHRLEQVRMREEFYARRGEQPPEERAA